MKNDNDKITKAEEIEIDDELDKNFDKEIEELKQKAQGLESDYKRALADYQNLQKRTNEDRLNWLKIANRELLLNLMPVLDTLILAQKHIKNDGLKVSIDQFLDVLKTEGVAKIETDNKDFDPNLMECIATETGEENKVLEETRAGYTLHDKVLRPAQVKVGKK
jgi:molecular chaperone GrpE